jgi:glycine/D-amino acid oxidase-like deaminating enzyme
MQKTQTIVVGGGLLGMATAYGLARLGQRVCVLDEGDSAFRASRGNFGLLWVQGKGYGMAPYAHWTRQGVALWPELAGLLQVETGIDVQLRQPGGFQLCLSESELAEEVRRLQWLRDELGDYPFEVLRKDELSRRLPGVGPAVVGACYSPMDGHVNPLKLLHALYQACLQQGVRLLTGHKVLGIEARGSDFLIAAGDKQLRCEQLVLAAGLGNRELGAQLGHEVPLQPSRGQILVTERVEPFLNHPTSTVRQTDEGTVQLGDSAESVGFDDGTSTAVMADIADRAVRSFPRLGTVRLVRAWGALRVLTPDGCPIYQPLSKAPGAYLLSCHSGVTLAAIHALRLAPWIAGKIALPEVAAFGLDRFNTAAEVRHAG